MRLDDARAHLLGDELLIYVAHSNTAHALNRSAAAIWELCDGTRTVEEISREIGGYLGRPADELLADVELGVEELQKLGLLKTT